MKVRLLQNIVNLEGPGTTSMKGAVVEVEDELAKRNIARGLMEKAGKLGKESFSVEDDTAKLKKPEKDKKGKK